jgi:S1-C subfamily serine protease
MGRILMLRGLPAVFALACALLVPAGMARGQAIEAFEREVIDLVERVRPSVVKVRAVKLDRNGGEREVVGSGVVIDDQGTIATIGSVVRGATEVELELPSGRIVKARLLGIDERMNIAILQAESTDLKPLVPAHSGELRVGAFTLTVGNPFGLTGSVGTGIVSGLEREVQSRGLVGGERKTVIYYDLVQTTAPINPGDSGGALVDSRGRMIGMLSSTFGRAPSMQRIREMIQDFARKVDVTQVQTMISVLDLTEKQQVLARMLLARFKAYQDSIANDETARERPTVIEGMGGGMPGASLGAQGINFAIPADQVHFAARMIRAHGRVVRLGVRAEVPDPSLRAQAGLKPGEGLVISDLTEGTPAAGAGLRRYDILLTVSGRPVGHPRDLRRALVAAPVDVPVPVTVLRGGETITLAIRY